MPDSATPLNRAQISEQSFKHQIDKAYRKGKLIQVINRKSETEETSILIDPSLVLFIADVERNQVDPFGIALGGVSGNIPRYLIPTSAPEEDKPQTLRFYLNKAITHGDSVKEFWEICQQATPDKVYERIMEADPTPNKVYVRWVIGLYTRILKDRTPQTSFAAPENRMGGFAYLFFEDLHKLPDALRYFHKIKNSKALTVEQRDIYSYKTINSFVETVFLAQADPTEPEVLNTEVFSAKELDQLNKHNAVVVHQDPDWVVVHTKVKEANVVFGSNTTWCTAGDRYSTMFDSYNRQGHLFILMRNRVGASSHLRSNPANRLQFHFESDQYRDVTNRQIDILTFFNENIGIKSYFRTYIIDKLIAGKSNLKDIMSMLKKYGMVRELIPLLREAGVKQLDLSDMITSANELDLADVGTITTLEELTIRACGLTAIPPSIRQLKNLRILRLSSNNITEVPTWINELTELEVLILMENNILSGFDVSNLTNLVELHLAFNKKMPAAPTGLGNLPNLKLLDMSFCNINAVGDEIMNCTALVNLNCARNRNLRSVPLNIMTLPELKVLTLDDTGIPELKQREIASRRIKKETILVQ